MPMFDKLFQHEIHNYITAMNNPASFKPYSFLGEVNISGKGCQNYLKLQFITTTMRSLSL